jgi:hypothetical protein
MKQQMETYPTQEQETESLNKIKSILAELGDKSYLTIAMRGVLEIAEDNIKNRRVNNLYDELIAVKDRCKSYKRRFILHRLLSLNSLKRRNSYE